jgi:hypothetical protein
VRVAEVGSLRVLCVTNGLFSGRSRYEGFSIRVVEALASNCPPFNSAHPALLTAAGYTTVVENEPSSVLQAPLSVKANGAAPATAERTSSQRVLKLLVAMR